MNAFIHPLHLYKKSLKQFRPGKVMLHNNVNIAYFHKPFRFLCKILHLGALSHLHITSSPTAFPYLHRATSYKSTL